MSVHGGVRHVGGILVDVFFFSSLPYIFSYLTLPALNGCTLFLNITLKKPLILDVQSWEASISMHMYILHLRLLFGGNVILAYKPCFQYMPFDLLQKWHAKWVVIVSH